MNSLSWFLYASDVVDKANTFTGAILVGGVFVVVFGAIFSPLAMMLLEDAGMKLSDFKGWGRIASIVWVVAGIFFIVVPSKNTMYAIAASEVGERAMQSEQVTGIASDATKALRQWIRRQIEPEKKG